MNESITGAIDAMEKVSKILDFLSSEVKNTGLCFILDGCCNDLVTAGVNLQVAQQNQAPRG